MKQNFIFTLILLATFSLVNAAQLYKRETKFNACPIDDPNVTQLTVTIKPDPPVAGKSLDVTITGKINEDVPKDSTDIVVDVVFLDPNFQPIADPVTVELCKSKGVTCPVKSGTEFTTESTVTVPSELGKGTTLVADVYDNSKSEFLACAISDPLS